jgi:hypothetical protein
MAALRPRRRRWLVRRRRYQVERGAWVTHIWLFIPLFPLHIRSWRSPDRSVGSIQVRFGTSSARGQLIFNGILLVALAVVITYDVATGRWMSRISDYLMLAANLCLGGLLWLRYRHQRQ